MREELKLHIRKLKVRATLSLVAMILAFTSLLFAILLLFFYPIAAVVFFVALAALTVYLIFSVRATRREAREKAFSPVAFNADFVSFEKISDVFGKLSSDKEQIYISENERFFRFEKIFKARIVLYKTSDFKKKEFDSSKNKINKRANKELKISQKVNFTETTKMMRLNIICADSMNDELCGLISQNAVHNLTRVEGIVNIAVTPSEIVIPPIYGECSLLEITRYEGVIKFIDQIILG